jgi:nucleotide-binding universal stress UspA family protein
MKTIKKILVPVDLSDNSLHTTLYAIEFAKHHQSKVTVLYSSEVPLIYGISADYGDGMSMDNSLEMMETYQIEDKQAHIQLDAFKRKVKELTEKKNLMNVKVGYTYDFGSTKTNINYTLETDHIDLIIAGIHDQQHPSKLVKGISEKLLRDTKIPVLIVPEKASFQMVKEVVYTTNFSRQSVDEIKKFLDFVASFNVKTHCIHIGDMLNENQQMDFNIKPFFKDNNAIDFENLPSAIYIDELFEYIKENNIQMLGLHAHKKHIWTQLFEKDNLKSILHLIDIPVLTVH